MCDTLRLCFILMQQWHIYQVALSRSAQANPYQHQVPLITWSEESKWVDCSGSELVEKAIDWCRMWTSNRITPVITTHELHDDKTRKLESGFVFGLWVLPEISALLTCWVGWENRTHWESVIHFFSNIKAISYIIPCISIQCPTVWQILIKLHHSDEKEWSSLSSSGWNDFIRCLVAWWMMKCWPKNQKWANKTKQQTRLEYPKDSHWRRKKEIDILSTVFVCYAVNLLRICPHTY